MACKPENTFITGVHRHLPRTVYAEKMANPYRGGTPDVWYSGPVADLWIEYKYLPKLPKQQVTPALSALQTQWLAKRRSEGRNLAVIVGCPDGGVVFRDQEWEHALPTPQFQARLLPRPALAAWISNTVC
jgi:hypothetical protein